MSIASVAMACSPVVGSQRPKSVSCKSAKTRKTSVTHYFEVNAGSLPGRTFTTWKALSRKFVSLWFRECIKSASLLSMQHVSGNITY